MTACMPCRGRGWITQEDASGMPGRDVTCPYCKGRGTAWWVAGKRKSRLRRFTHRRLVILGLALVLLSVGHDFPPLSPATVLTGWLFILHVALWVALLVAWMMSPPRRKVERAAGLRKPRHAPGFDTPREGKFLAGFAAVVGLRGLWDSEHKRGF